MNFVYGMDAGIGLSFQNSYGTSNTASMHWLEPISESVDLKKAMLVRKGMRGIYDEGAYQEGANSVGGDISIEARALPLGALLSAVMNRTTVTSTGVYTHTFKPRTVDWDDYSAERPFTYHKHLGDTGSAHLYSDLNGNHLELSVKDGELLTAKLGVIGGTYSQIAEVAAVYPTGDALNWAVASASLGGAGRAEFRALNVTVNNNLEAKQTLGIGRFPKRVKRNAQRVVDISGTLLFNSQTDMQSFINQAEQRFFLQLTSPTQIQSGYYESLNIDIPSMRFTEHPIPIGNPAELEIAFKAKGVYNTGSATNIAITLVNSKAGY